MSIREEVWEIVSSVKPDSLVGPDGFAPIFYHTCWDFISEDVFGAVSELFSGVEMPKGFTVTTISIIPKTASPISRRRWLNNNVPLAQELIHLLESRWLEVNVVFKLDMAKAYDRVSWEFLYQGLQQGDPLSPVLLVLAADYLSRQNMEMLRDFLRAYERVSGQLINGAKSSFRPPIRGRSRQDSTWEAIRMTHLSRNYWQIFDITLYDQQY
ncbi:UNVERIFIED_CONTAM: hypothetical protein Sangu_2570900 [Sesamum angustifolium]|uniref:Reverse transcriptase domain-containing protein n=1 Tax=Sesamum angustifolium TaxID=2727405 RepID=A0AAW2J865_9LAMI